MAINKKKLGKEIVGNVKKLRVSRITKLTSAPVEAVQDLDLDGLLDFLKQGELTEKRRTIKECSGSPGRGSYIILENKDMSDLFKKENFTFVLVMAFSLKPDPDCAFYFAIEDKNSDEFIFIGNEYRLKNDKRMPTVNKFMNEMFDNYEETVEKILKLINIEMNFDKLALKMINTRLASPFFSAGGYKIDKKTITHKIKTVGKRNADNLFEIYNGIIKATGGISYVVTTPKGVKNNSNVGVINHSGRVHQLRVALSKDIGELI